MLRHNKVLALASMTAMNSDSLVSRQGFTILTPQL